MDAPIYLHLKPGDAPPQLDSFVPFKAVVVVESDVTPEWQAEISAWLVQSGCRYMSAWGNNCSGWDDSVDWAALEMFDFGDIPLDGFVMTSLHENASLEETFWFCGHNAHHPSLDLRATYIVHIAQEARESELSALFLAAQV
ncbi:MAG TPA: hypothetical protein VHL34_05685 [Rhizomicrobium sp.]|jgi:hypothetical protein|nr:hypothetical protein [Rhizomicrobium sp.]